MNAYYVAISRNVPDVTGVPAQESYVGLFATKDGTNWAPIDSRLSLPPATYLARVLTVFGKPVGMPRTLPTFENEDQFWDSIFTVEADNGKLIPDLSRLRVVGVSRPILSDSKSEGSC